MAIFLTLSHSPGVVIPLLGTFVGRFAQQVLKSAGNPLDYFTSCLTLELGQVSFHVNRQLSEKTSLNLSLNVAQQVISRGSGFPLLQRKDRWGLGTWFIVKPKQIRDSNENKNGQVVNFNGYLILPLQYYYGTSRKEGKSLLCSRSFMSFKI